MQTINEARAKPRALNWLEYLLQALLLLVVLAGVFPRFFFAGEVLSPAAVLFSVPPWNAHAPENWRGNHPPDQSRPRYFLNSDNITAFHPFYTISSEAVRAGEWPLWNNRQLMGAPLMANYQSAVFYPPRVLHYFFDVVWATSIFIVLKLWLCGMTAYCCGRGLGLRVGGARFFSLAWMLCGYNLYWAYWPLPDVSAWLPIVLLGAERLLQHRARAGIVYTVAGGTLMMLAGHPETAFAMALGVTLYFLLRLLLGASRGQPWAAALGSFAGAWVLALLASAVQWLPFIEYVAHSHELHTRAAHTMVSALPAPAVVQFFIPRFFGTEADYTWWGATDSNRFALYPGAAVWLGIALLAAVWRELGHGRIRLTAMGVVALLQVLIVFDAPTISLLHTLPGLASLRQNYHIGFPLLVIAYAGAQGFDTWLQRSRPWRDVLWPIPIVAAVAALVALLLHFYGGLPAQAGVLGYVRSQIASTAVFAAVGILLMAFHVFTRRPRLVFLLLALVLAVDLVHAARRVHPSLPRNMAFFDTPLIDYLREKGHPVRVDVRSASIPEGVITAFGIEEWLGYDGITPWRTLRLVRELGDDRWNAFEPAMSIQYYLHDPRHDDDPRLQYSPFASAPLFPRTDPDYFVREAAIDGVEIYRNLKALPRAFLAGSVSVVPDHEELIGRLRGHDFDPQKEVLAPWAPEGPLPQGLLAPGAQADVVRYDFNRVEIAVETASPAALVLADAWFPGWTATLDERPVEIFPAFDAFRGVLVPQGRHALVFTYAPWTFRWGLRISATTLILLAIAVVLRWLRCTGARRIPR